MHTPKQRIAALIASVVAALAIQQAPAMATPEEPIDQMTSSDLKALREQGDLLGMTDSNFMRVTQKLQAGETLDSDSGVSPASVEVSKSDYFITTRNTFKDGSVSETVAPDFEAMRVAAEASGTKAAGSFSVPNPTGNVAAKAGSVSQCVYTYSTYIITYKNCVVKGSNINVGIQHRLDYSKTRTGTRSITKYWDQQVQSYTGSISPIGFHKVNGYSLTYKTTWTMAYVGAPSQIYTLSSQVTTGGGLSVQLY